MNNEGPRAKAMMSEFGGRMTLEEIGEKTFEDPVLCQLREDRRCGEISYQDEIT